MHDVTVQAPEQTQVGVITFSYDAKREFDMNTYSTKDEVLQAVESIHYKVSDGESVNIKYIFFKLCACLCCA